ncbi:efflux RND transporter periplasmic adaptor subunit [Chitinophaga sp.]|uniref:efflux RND transporter periplasmic adaptor subunit n=1 Tax=Chitinophaga sp. TaxID=1869181 RepID=UPI0031D7F5A5
MNRIAIVATIIMGATGFTACNHSANHEQGNNQGPAPYPVISLKTQKVEISTLYPATLQGEQNIEIRPKVDGFVDKIYVDEGDFVKQGQLLFTISAPQYEESMRNAAAAISSAEADVSTAELQVNKTKPLVEKGIISHYDLESAEYSLKAKRAALAQAKANLNTARINVGYTTINSPVAGVIGSLPYKQGSLVSSTSAQPLTTVSNIQHIYGYFSLNEKQLFDLYKRYSGKTLEEKLRQLPDVELVLADGAVYPEKGRIAAVNGLINSATGSITFRATFPNPVNLIRSGGSANVKIPQTLDTALIIPQQASFEMQGKHFVYVVTPSGKVKNTEIEIVNTTFSQCYVVSGGLHAGDKIVTDGISKLKDGDQIQPQLQTTETEIR